MLASKQKSYSKRGRWLIDSYLTARETVVKEGFATEIDWQDSRNLNSLTEPQFLEEFTWVVLSSGMRESVIRGLFSRVSEAFLSWESAKAITRKSTSCRNDALRIFNNKGKINAVMATCKIIANTGFYKFRDEIENNGVDFISTLNFMGPATSYHLAKNIGLDVVKPDRHLVRIAQSARFKTPAALCSKIAEQTGDKVSVIDIVLWRYATLDRSYISFFEY